MSAITEGRQSRTWAGYLLGFALGGFFDGILLHQVLQWHHLLSGVEAVRDLRTQLLADGLFHVLMYVVALAGLWSLWRGALRNANRSQLLCDALIGFGAWHVIDAVASHWILGIHRIKMDAASPLLWDLLWFFVFGVAFILAGAWMRGRSGGAVAGRRTAVSLAVAVLLAGPIAALPPPGVNTVLLVKRAEVNANDVWDAVVRLNGAVLWVDRGATVWAVQLQPGVSATQLYPQALIATRSTLALGCLSWLRAG